MCDFIAHVKTIAPEFLGSHCIIHRQVVAVKKISYKSFGC
jgi:hypothetical protein